MESLENIAPQPESSAPTVKERSTIAFPYSDLDAAIEVVRGVHNAGGTACDIDQLAAQLSMEAKGGGFRLRVNGAQTFGLVTYERGRVSLTELGRQVIDPAKERQARVTSFLTVELFAKVHEDFKGGPLPPQAGLKRAIVKMGVGEKVADRARQALMRSAKQAGFFEQAGDRLVKPPIKNTNESDAGRQSDPAGQGDIRQGAGSGGGGDGKGLHPLIEGLLVTLPAPGSLWPSKDRVNWLIMVNGIFNAIYKTEPSDQADIKIDRQSHGDNDRGDMFTRG